MSEPPVPTLPRSSAPGFLIASPRLDGSPFERAIVAMVHHDQEGAMGFIVNKPLEIDFGSLIQSVNEDIARRLTPESFEMPVYFGGPVRIEQLWVIYQRLEGIDADQAERRRHLRRMRQGDEGELTFMEGWYLAASGEIIEGFAQGLQPGRYRPFIGYAGWGPGQLEEEIEEGSWLMLDFAPHSFFHPRPGAQWEESLAELGVDPAAFLMMARSGSA
ncbi:hypothetical protein DL240_13990 [Lujinxingia litoralis]|uniref:UPF0301 protein DL240_13990 n=1 Tax=Lujinxingia litoralis TaxID=2211119 RepID=A0A328C744_9DELT|nr:YqgE/AlgH family protein [Lujinxingia litoralis]RAL21237.1 hypothetical protein DL240_13990 [Lujinxingia litoralis]